MSNVSVVKQRSMKQGEVVVKVSVYIGLILFALTVIVPFLVVVLTSFKSEGEASEGFTWLFKEGFKLDGYRTLFSADNNLWGTDTNRLLNGLGNTMIIVLPATFVGLLVSAVSAYAFAKIDFPLKKVLFGVLLATMMLPYIITVAPTYLIYDSLNLVNTKFPLMVPGMFGAAACVFFMRQFYSGIPTDLVEAAKIDGCNHFKIFFKIMVPLSMSALIAQAVLGFLAGYNDYFAPALYLQDESQQTLQLALAYFSGGQSTNWPVVMAGALIALAPTILLYLFAQRYFIEGIATSGMKI